MPDPATTQAQPNLADVLAELKRSNDLKEKALAAPAPIATITETKTVEPEAKGATQTDEQAISARIETARQRLANLEAEAQNREYLDLEAKIAAFTNKKAQAASRTSELSLADAVDHIRGTFSAARAQTAEVFRELSGVHREFPSDYVRLYGDLNPVDLLIRGAMVPEHGSGGMVRFTPATDDQLVREVRDLNDGVLIWRAAEKAAGRDYSMTDCPLWKRWIAARKHLHQQIVGKALDTTDTSNFVPTGFSAELIVQYDLARNVTKKMRAFQIPRFGTQIPGSGSAVTVYAIAENTADTENATAVTTSDPVDRATTWARHRLGARTCISYDLEADSIIPQAQWAREELGRGLGIGEERFIVDSDNATFHMDVDITGALNGTDVRRQIIGLRASAVDNSYTTSLATFTVENINLMIEQMDKYAANPADCCWIGPARVRAKLAIARNTGNFPMAMGGFGSPITDSGAAAASNFLGIDYVAMETFRVNLNASGFYDGTTTNTTGLLLVNHRRWGYAYDNLAPVVESSRWARTQQMEIVVTVRRDFQALDTTSAEHTVHYGIAIPTT